MRTPVLSSLLTLALAASASLPALAQSSGAAMPNATPASTIGTVQTMTVSPKDMATLRSTTAKYLESALGDEQGFYSMLAPGYLGVGMTGKTYTPGQVYGAVQVLKQPLSGIVSRVKVIDAHHVGDLYDETALIGGTADTIDSSGNGHSVAATWVHKITFKRQPDGSFLIQRDQVLQKI